MNKTLTILFLIASLISFAQTAEIHGEYFLKLGNEKTFDEYRLTLKEDKTFLFQSYRNHENGIPSIIELYGKGTWISNGRLISFFADQENDFDKKFTLDFGNSSARFVTKSSRDNTDRLIKTRLKFFESKIFWIEGIDIFKI